MKTQSTPALATGDDRTDNAAAIIDQLTRFVRTMKRSNARFAARQADGIELAAYTLLAHLATEGPQRTTALAEAVHSDTSTVSRQVGALVGHGLVERQADPADGRACLLAATEQGQHCFTQQHRARTEEVKKMLAHWSPEDLRAAVHLLDRLNTEMERHEQRQSGAEGTVFLKGGTR